MTFMLCVMPQSLSSLPAHFIFSTKDRCPFLGKSDLLRGEIRQALRLPPLSQFRRRFAAHRSLSLSFVGLDKALGCAVSRVDENDVLRITPWRIDR